MSMLYLDHAASTPLTTGAWQVLQESSLRDFANPISPHRLGRTLGKKLEEFRKSFLQAVAGENYYDFFFTGSATESNNTILRGFLTATATSTGTLFYSEGDHPSITFIGHILPQHFPSSQKLLQLQQLPLRPDSSLDEELLLQQMRLLQRPGQQLWVVLSHVNNHTGVELNIHLVGQKIKKEFPTAFIHVDAAQSFMKLPLDLQGQAIDSLSISAHKMGGPKGVAGLYLHKKHSPHFPPLLLGGSQELGFRASTPAYPLIHAFTQALMERRRNLSENLAHLGHLQQHMRESLQRSLSAVMFPFGNKISPYILSFIVPGIPSDILLRFMEEKEIYLSSSSACSGRMKKVNPTFTALNIPQQFHQHVLRASLGPNTTLEELEQFVEHLAQVVRDLSQLQQVQR